MKNLILLCAVALLSGCATKVKFLDASAISMSRSGLLEGEKLQETGPVTGKFCTDSGDKGTIGLLDESVKAAQRANKIDFITNAAFYREGSCVTVEGTGAKVVGTGAVSTSETPTKPTRKTKTN